MALNIASMLSGPGAQGLGAYGQLGGVPAGGAKNLAGETARLVRTDPMHYSADGKLGLAVGQGGADGGAPSAASFQAAMLRAMDGVNSSQMKSTELTQRMLTDPESVDAQDVTISMAEANMSLNLARTIMTRVVTAWKDIINTR